MGFGATPHKTGDFMDFKAKRKIDLSIGDINIDSFLKTLHNEVLDTTKNIIDLLINIVEFRDIESGQHSRRTRDLSEILICEMLREPKFSGVLTDLGYDKIIRAMPLHDIGKIAIPDEILLKKGKLTDKEIKIIQRHPITGGDIITSVKSSLNSDYYTHCMDVCRYHHERYDGSGYPYGLKGPEIPISARILAVVDVYDALTSERPYKQPLPCKDAIGIITEGIGTQFDPEIAMIFIELESKLKSEVI